jgi:energy-converting hydrogenase A subunit M
MPADRIAMMNYEEASLLSQTYAAIIVEPIGLDMEIDVEDVVSLLRQHLGVAGEDPLRNSYTWRSKELGFR